MERKSLIKDRKGQVNTLAPAILSLVFAAVVLIFGIVMSQELRDTQTGDYSASVANESITAFVGDTNQTLAGASTCGFGAVDTTSLVVYNATNSSGGTTAINIVGSANYTIGADGQLSNATDDYSDYAWQVSYDYSWGGEACISANKTVVGLGAFADFWEIIVLAIVITVVIGLLLIIFGGRRQR